MDLNNKNGNILFLHGRPAAHIMHERFASQVTDSSMFIDPLIRWQDKNIFKPFQLLAWIINAIYIVIKRKEQIVIIDGLHITGILIRFFSFHKKKIIALLADQTLYFLASGYFKLSTRKILIFAFNKYDALICVGKMGLEMLNSLPLSNRPPSHSTFIGVPHERQKSLELTYPDLLSHNLLLIATGWKGWRFWYKGLDLMIKAFDIAAEKDPELRFKIVGYWPDEIQKLVCKDIKYRSRIDFIGNSPDIITYIKSSGLYFHCARGDAFPTSVLESMTGGLPALVSEWTGSREFIRELDENFICPLDENIIAEKISWYMSIPSDRKKMYSEKFRKTALKYTEENAMEDFTNTFNKVLDELKIKP